MALQRCEPWSQGYPAQGRTVDCAPDRLTVVVDGADADAVAGPWKAAIESKGFSLVEDGSREGWVSVRYADGDQPLVLGAWVQGSRTTVSLVTR